MTFKKDKNIRNPSGSALLSRCTLAFCNRSDGVSCNLQPDCQLKVRKALISLRKGWHCACDSILPHKSTFRSDRMADIIFILVTVVFFAISLAYVRACDRL